MWYFKILFLNFQHPLFFRDPFISLLKLRTFGYTSPHGAGCSNPKNTGWMNNICNSLHVVSLFPFLFWGKRFLVCAKQCGRKNSFLDFSCAWRSAHRALYKTFPYCWQFVKQGSWFNEVYISAFANWANLKAELSSKFIRRRYYLRHIIKKI